MNEARPFAELIDSGLLWLVNASTFHPRGVALSLHLDDDGNAVGWSLVDGLGEPFTVPDVDAVPRFRRAEATITAARTPPEAP